MALIHTGGSGSASTCACSRWWGWDITSGPVCSVGGLWLQPDMYSHMRSALKVFIRDLVFFVQLLALFPITPNSYDHHFYGVTSGFRRLIIETKYVWHSLVSLHNDRKMEQ